MLLTQKTHIVWVLHVIKGLWQMRLTSSVHSKIHHKNLKSSWLICEQTTILFISFWRKVMSLSSIMNLGLFTSFFLIHLLSSILYFDLCNFIVMSQQSKTYVCIFYWINVCKWKKYHKIKISRTPKNFAHKFSNCAFKGKKLNLFTSKYLDIPLFSYFVILRKW